MFMRKQAAYAGTAGNFGGTSRGQVSRGNEIIASLAAGLLQQSGQDFDVHRLARMLDAFDRIIEGNESAIDLIYARHLMKKLSKSQVETLRNLRNKHKKKSFSSSPLHKKVNKFSGAAMTGLGNWKKGVKNREKPAKLSSHYIVKSEEL